MKKVIKLVKKLGLDKDAKPSDELKWSIEYLKWKIKPEELIGISRLVLLILTPALAVITSIFTRNPLAIAAFSIVPALGISWYVNEYPKTKARLGALNDLGYAPNIITLLATSVELNPNLENAVKLVSRFGEGRIAEEFGKALNKSLLYGASLKKEIRLIGEKWGKISSGFKNGLHLIMAGLNEKEQQRRREVISLGVNAFLDELINDLKAFLAKTKMHTMVIYGFGTVMPLIIISLLPIISTLSSFANPPMIALLMAGSLVALYTYTNKSLKSKPGTFSQVTIKERSWFPKKGDIRLFGLDFNALAYCLAIFAAISLVSWIYIVVKINGGEFLIPKELSMMPLIMGLAIALSTYYYGSSNYKMSLRKKAKTIESEVLNAVYNLASRVHENRSIEDAIKFAARENREKSIGAYLRKAYSLIINSNVEAEEALNKAFFEVDSKRVKSIINMVFNSLKRGIKTGAHNILRIYDYYKRLVQAETESRNLLSQMLSMMRLTAMLFAPAISAMIVMLQQIIQENVIDAKSLAMLGISSMIVNPSLGYEFIALLLGIYTIALAIMLTRYAVIMEHGHDKVLLNYELSKAVIVSSTVFCATLFLGFAIS